MARDAGSLYARAKGRSGGGAGRRRIQGDKAFKRLLVRMSGAVRDEMVEMLDDAGVDIALMQRADAPSARARAAISRRVLKGALQLKVGILGRPLNRRLFFLGFVERGRKAQVATAAKRQVSSSTRKLGYRVRVQARASRSFIYTARAKEARNSLGGRIESYWGAVLQRASQGISDD